MTPRLPHEHELFSSLEPTNFQLQHQQPPQWSNTNPSPSAFLPRCRSSWTRPRTTRSRKKNWPSATVSVPASLPRSFLFGRHSSSCFATHTGTDPSRPTLVAIKGVVFDVTRNAAYGPSGQYRGECLSECGGVACASAVRFGTDDMP